MTQPQYPLRAKMSVVAGVLLAAASLAEFLGLVMTPGGGHGGPLRLSFGFVAGACSVLIFLKVRYAPYVVLPVALGIFFTIVYQTALTAVSVYELIPAGSLLLSALVCFMIIRAHKT